MTNCKPSPTPFQSRVKLTNNCDTTFVDDPLCQLVGTLIYLTHSRLDLSFVVRLVSRFMQKPHDNHWKGTKNNLRYLQGTLHYGVFYSSKDSFSLIAHTDIN